MGDEPVELPEERRALIVFFDDTTNEVDVYADEFTWLEVPELLRHALDWVEENQPITAYADDTEDPE